jgi:hypothetical protein
VELEAGVVGITVGFKRRSTRGETTCDRRHYYYYYYYYYYKATRQSMAVS